MFFAWQFLTLYNPEETKEWKGTKIILELAGGVCTMKTDFPSGRVKKKGYKCGLKDYYVELLTVQSNI